MAKLISVKEINCDDSFAYNCADNILKSALREAPSSVSFKVPQIHISISESDDNRSSSNVNTEENRKSTSKAPLYVNPAFNSDDDSITNSSPPVSPDSPPINNLNLQSNLFSHQIAVEMRNVVFGYGKAQILNNVNITVPHSKIYALLGSSGCGKTTLLRHILGRLKPKNGKVTVFGIEPGTKLSNIPGAGVGYMPQELSLFTQFTIAETLQYFGRLFHMKKDVINNRIEFLITLLNLPDKNKKISQLSGGQQRRASIAATLFHQPPLLILDEPTVGLDPLLRCRIWEYLEQLCRDEHLTVIITTHYIEEARNASTVGFMRFGRLLAQSNPNDLMKKHHCTTLEDVFLKLCQVDCGEIKRRMSSVVPNDRRHIEAMEEIQRRKGLRPRLSRSKSAEDTDDKNNGNKKTSSNIIDTERLKALLYKNYTTLTGNPFLVFFFLILPVVQITLFCSSVGQKPKNLPVAIYNAENPPELSQAFLDKINPNMIIQKEYDSLEEAKDAVRRGKAWYAISMSANFSDAFDVRATMPQSIDDETLEESKIKLYVDMTNGVIGPFIYRSLLEGYQKFVEEFLTTMGYDPNSVTLPLDVKEPIYGTKESYVDEFIAPGAIVAIIYGTPLILASFLLVLERTNGLLERSLVAGVRPYELLIAHLIVMFVGLLIQVMLLMFVTFVLFKVPLRGPFLDSFGLILMQGLSGIVFGLLISSIAVNEIAALISSFGLIFPIWMVSGVFWPQEGVPQYLHPIIMISPLTYPINALRSIISRGWTILHREVQIGYAVSGVYISVLFILTLFVFRKTSA